MTTREGIRVALKALGLTGLTGTTVAAPNTTSAFTQIIGNYIMDESIRSRVYKELARQGLIQITEVGHDSRNISLSIKGAHRLLDMNIDELIIAPMKQWDYHWRLVCFDIPKGKDRERQYFNRRLHELGFTMLQRSMWVYPFECFDVIRQITDHINLTRYVSVIEAMKLDERSTRELLRKYEHLLHT